LNTVDNLYNYGCYPAGSAVITPPADRTQGTMGRNIFRGPKLHQLGYVVIEDVEAERADQAATSRRGI
jgi:hypothetical protein